MARKRDLIRRPASEPVAPITYTVEVLGRRFAVVDMVDASRKVDYVRDSTGMGAGEMGSQFPVRDGDKIIAFVTFNGRVWAGSPRDYGTDRVHLVYDPSEKAHRDAHAIPGTATPARIVRNNPHGDPYRPCGAHEDSDECRADPTSCRWGGCDAAGHSFREPSCKTKPRYYADTKSFFCDEGRVNFLREYHWDDARGEWVNKDGDPG